MNAITPVIDFRTELAGLHDLSGKVAFVPGGYGGLGAAIAWGLAINGASVVIAGRSLAKAAELADALVGQGFEAAAQAVDVTAVGEIRDATDFVMERFGRLDILVNCVGIQREEPMLEVTEEAFDDVYRVNLKAAMFLAQACARHQVAKQSGGKQIHLLSVRAQLGLQNRGYSAYCSTKGGVALMIKQHAVELARDGITVNGVAPTFVYTEMIRHVMENPEFRDHLYKRIPLGRIADPKDVVGPVLFFASPASDFVTGQVLYVDGGLTATQ
jgi:NAD(P)-dependent dehydrogenase (short-subunit alcohol dehydrogenase family)